MLLIVPVTADQVTEELLTAPVTLAENCTVEPARTVSAVGEMVMATFCAVKVAVTPTEEVLMVKLQVPVPEQAPLQPENTDDSDAGVAVRVINVPLLKLAEQVAPQLMPAGALVTEPVPVKVTVTGKEEFAVTPSARL